MNVDCNLERNKNSMEWIRIVGGPLASYIEDMTSVEVKVTNMKPLS